MPHLRRSLVFALLISPLLLFFYAGSAQAKQLARFHRQGLAMQSWKPGHRISRAQVRDFEARLRPYLEARIHGRVPALPESQRPSEYDMLMLARVSDSLSPSFKTLYRQATAPPASYRTYNSPGGHFTVYFTTGDGPGVDSTDTFGYGTAGNWRPRHEGANGVPDYVDEVAWALDSAWSLEVGRFGFNPPIDSFTGRYRVVVTNQLPSLYTYGQTTPETDGRSFGFASSIDIRNRWPDSIWHDYGYDTAPANAVRVTCAHEFFHAIKYSMIASQTQVATGLSDGPGFPIAWWEGTAVLMEHLCFNYVKDYLQYAPIFTSAPTRVSFLDNTGGDSPLPYTNSLLTIFLFERALASPRIDFVKQVFFNDYNRPADFFPNIRATALSLNTTWPAILNHFFAASYFTGSRGDSTRFISDAKILPSWNFAPDSTKASFTKTKSVVPEGMQIFDYAPPGGNFDTLTVTVAGQDPHDTVPLPVWGASCIVRGGGLPDSLIPLTFTAGGTATCRIVGNGVRSEVLVIPSNSYPQDSLRATVSFVASGTLPPGVPSLAAPGNNAADCQSALRFSWNHVSEATSYTLQVSTGSGFASTVFGQSGLIADTQTVTGLAMASSYFWRVRAANASINGAWSPVWSFRTSTFATLAIFPNPGSLKGSRLINFQGGDISAIHIYSVDGKLVSAFTGKNPASFRSGTTQLELPAVVWPLTNGSGKTVVPGYYTAVVEQAAGGQKRNSVRKIMVIP